jgi:hypothetical protein
MALRDFFSPKGRKLTAPVTELLKTTDKILPDLEKKVTSIKKTQKKFQIEPEPLTGPNLELLSKLHTHFDVCMFCHTWLAGDKRRKGGQPVRCYKCNRPMKRVPSLKWMELMKPSIPQESSPTSQDPVS